MEGMNQLVERWHEVAGARGNDLALVEAGSGSAWSFRDLGRVIDERSRALAGVRVVFPISSGAGFVIETLAGWSAGAVVCPCETGAAVPTVPAPDDWPDGVIMAKTTSGTSGEPKLVFFDAVALETDARQIVSTMGLEPDVPNVGAISLAHSYGFSNLVLPLALEGVPLRLAGSPLPESVRRAIGEEKFVVLPGVPAMWARVGGVGDHRLAHCAGDFCGRSAATRSRAARLRHHWCQDP